MYVDYLFEAEGPGGHRRWCHMTADTVEELHEMAEAVGMKREWFQDKRIPHYDLLPISREEAVAKGAMEISVREMVMRARGSHMTKK